MSGSAAPSLKQEKVRKLKEFIFPLQHTYLDIKPFIVRKLKEFIFLLQHTYLDIKPFIVKCFSK